MTSELLEKYVEIVKSGQKRPTELSAYEFGKRAGVGKDVAKRRLEQWVKEKKWSKREIPYGDKFITWYEPLE